MDTVELCGYCFMFDQEELCTRYVKYENEELRKSIYFGVYWYEWQTTMKATAGKGMKPHTAGEDFTMDTTSTKKQQRETGNSQRAAVSQ